MDIRHAITKAVMQEIVGRPDCPEEVRAMWNEYMDVWDKYDGHWAWTTERRGTRSEYWGALMTALAKNNLLPEEFATQSKEKP
jgi:hypothetical protein